MLFCNCFACNCFFAVSLFLAQIEETVVFALEMIHIALLAAGHELVRIL